jgi:hypothetical protein
MNSSLNGVATDIILTKESRAEKKKIFKNFFLYLGGNSVQKYPLDTPRNIFKLTTSYLKVTDLFQLITKKPQRFDIWKICCCCYCCIVSRQFLPIF